MPTYKTTISNPEPGFHSNGYIGQLQLFGGTGKQITAISASMATGNATINFSSDPPEEGLIDLDDFDDRPLLLHLRAEDCGSPLSNVFSTAIGEWYSYNPEPTYYEQTVSGDQPSFEPIMGTDGNQGIYFDLEHLEATDTTVSTKYDDSFTCFVITGTYTVQNQSPIAGNRHIDDSSWRTWWGHKGGDMIFRNDHPDETNQGTDDITSDQIRVVSYQNNGASSARVSEYVDGTTYFSGTSVTISSTTGGLTFNAIGAVSRLRNGSRQSRNLKGAISELMMFKGVLTSVERILIEGYLAHKWGVTANLPAAHLYKTTDPRPSTSFLYGSDAILTSTMTSLGSLSKNITQAQSISIYLPEAQNPGTLSLEFTVG